jgi:hypothetical protein
MNNRTLPLTYLAIAIICTLSAAFIAGFSVAKYEQLIALNDGIAAVESNIDAAQAGEQQ